MPIFKIEPIKEAFPRAKNVAKLICIISVCKCSICFSRRIITIGNTFEKNSAFTPYPLEEYFSVTYAIGGLNIHCGTFSVCVGRQKGVSLQAEMIGVAMTA